MSINTANANTKTSSERGIFIITNADILNSEIVEIDCECQFFWNQLYSPTDLSLKRTTEPQYVEIPKVWTAYQIDGQKLPNHGFATYRFVIQKEADSQPTLYGLKVSTVFSSYKLWINGKFITEVGKVGTSKETSKPGFVYSDFPFLLDPAVDNTQSIEVVMQVSNFFHRRSGLHVPMYFGKQENLVNSTRTMDILNLIIVGIILLIGINHISLYLLRRSDVSNLYFGLVCLVMMIRNVSTGDRVISHIFSGIDWELLFKLDNISGFATIPLFALFFYSLFKNDFPRIVYRIVVAIGLLILLLVVFTPANIYGQLRTVYEAYVLLGGLYLTFGVLLRSSLKKRPYAIYSFIGMLILYGTAFNDVAGSMELVQTVNLAPYGLVVFMLIQSVTINIKSARAINANEILGNQLKIEKENLECKVEERISEIKHQQNELLQLQKREEIVHWKNNGEALINDVIVHHKDNYKELCYNSLVEVIKYIDAKLGEVFLLSETDEAKQLEMVASYGLSSEAKTMNAHIEVDSGLVGASFSKNIVQHITDIPADFTPINSGLGSAVPKSLLIVPLEFDGRALGVIELASFNDFTEGEIEFVEKVASVIAGNINNTMMNERNIKLIQQFKEKSQEMAENENRMRLNIEELEVVREQYERLKAEVAAPERKRSKKS